MPDTSAKWDIERPALDDDPPDIPAAFRAATDRIDDLLTPLARGVIGARPAAGKLGQRYIATDQNDQEYLDIGFDWIPLNPPKNVTVGDVKASFQTADHGDWKLMDGRNNILRSDVTPDYVTLALARGWVGSDGTRIGVPDSLGRMLTGLGPNADVNALGKNEGTGVGNRRPAHRHTVNEPNGGQGHAHGVNDPGHHHSVLSFPGLVDDGRAIPLRQQPIGYTDDAGAGQLIGNSFTGLGINRSATGITIGPQANVPQDGPAFLVVNFFIYTGETAASVVGGGGGSLGAPADVALATANLAAGAGESGVIPLGAGYRLLRVQADHPCRVRLYSTPAKRDADVGRPLATEPPDYPAPDASPNHGVMLEVNLTAAHLVAGVYLQDLAPNVAGSSGETPRNNNIAYRVDNTDVAAHVIDLTFTSQKLEG